MPSGPPPAAPAGTPPPPPGAPGSAFAPPGQPAQPQAPAATPSPPPGAPVQQPAAAQSPVVPQQPVAPAAQQPQQPPAPVIPNDPHGIGAAVARLSGSSRKRGYTALAMAALVLEDGEQVEQVLVGGHLGQHAACVLTSQQVLIVSESLWDPVVIRVPLDARLVVQGWHDNRTAGLSFQHADDHHVVDGIPEPTLAQEFAHRTRAHAGTGG